MTMISYAYNFEDVLLRRLFDERRDGYFVDIGAHHPTLDSVTRHFSDLGWTGINVEPIPDRAALFSAERPRDINLSAGISDTSGTLTFHEVVDGATLSTFSDELAEQYRQRGYNVVDRRVPVLTLADLFDEHVERTVDFLSIDVEGHEHEVLLGADFGRWRPRVVMVEATRPGTSIPSHDSWQQLLVEADYLFASFDGINRYYVRCEDEQLAARLAVPVNALDDFVPYSQVVLEQELGRYRTLNPLRRGITWARDFERAVRRSLSSRPRGHRRPAAGSGDGGSMVPMGH